HEAREGRRFTKNEEDLLSRVGLLAGAEIEKAKLLEECDAISAGTQALVSVLHYDQLLDIVLKNLRDGFGYTRCAVMLKDPATNELYIERAVEYPRDAIRNVRIKISDTKGVTAWVAKNGKPKIVPDVDKEPLYIMHVPGSRSE